MGLILFLRSLKNGRDHDSAHGILRKVECTNFGHYTFIQPGKQTESSTGS